MKRTPKLGNVGRAYSEMSPLNPTSSTSAANTSVTSQGQPAQGHRDSIGGYGSIFTFGFLRSSFSKSGSSLQVCVYVQEYNKLVKMR